MREVRLDNRTRPGLWHARRVVRAELRNAFGRPRPRWQGWGEPFNGQHQRTRDVGELIERFGPDAMIETGTYYGFTTKYLAAHGLPVYTVELDPGIRRLARRALRESENITLIHGDSHAGMAWIARNGVAERPFLYLDAHSADVNPLHAELATVLDRWADFVLLIDDFKVPDDQSYEYWTFKGTPLSLEALSLPRGVSVAFPSVAGVHESGPRRGVAYLGSGDGARVIEEMVTQDILAAART